MEPFLDKRFPLLLLKATQTYRFSYFQSLNSAQRVSQKLAELVGYYTLSCMSMHYKPDQSLTRYSYKIKPISVGSLYDGLKPLACSCTVFTRTTILDLSELFIRSLHFCIKDRPRKIASSGLFGKILWTHILFLMFQIAQARPAKQARPVWEQVLWSLQD
jgi:hypothetical protein